MQWPIERPSNPHRVPANATNHAAYAPDSLRAELMNLGPGGKQPVLRNGVQSSYPTDSEHARLEWRPDGHEASASKA